MQQSKFKILIVTNRVPYPLKDGGALAMQAMLDGYNELGWDVGLITMNTSRHPVPEDRLPTIFPHLKFLRSVPVENEISVRKIVKNFVFSKQPEHATRFWNVNFEVELKSAIETFQPDVVQFESVFLTSYLPIVKKHAQIVVALRMHNIEHQIWHKLASETKNPFKRGYLNNLAGRIENYEKEAWQQYDLLITITQNDEHYLKELNVRTPIHTATFGIIPPDEPRSNVVEKWEGYHIGAMDWLPNQEAVKWFVKQVWPEIRKEIPDFSFHFAGRNMPDEFFNFGTLGVHCAGEVENALKFISDKKILIVPLKSGSGIRIKTMEALAAGKLVISTDVGMKGINVVNKKHYIEANSKEEFVNALKWALANKAEANIIAENGKNLVNNDYDRRTIMLQLGKRFLPIIENKLNQ